MGVKKSWSTPMLTIPAEHGSNRRRIFGEVHDALIAIGLVQTADTGQLADFASVEAPATTGRVTYGYRIYVLNDALSDVSPVYLRVDFWVFGTSNPAFATLPDLAVSIGNGTNGAGVLSAGTPPRSFYSGDAITFNNTIFPAAALPSFAYSGEGLTWMALKCGYALGNSSATGIARPTVGGESAKITWFSFFIARPMDESGAPLPGAAIGVPSPRMKVSGGFYSYETYHLFVDAMSASGVVATTTSAAARVMPDVMGSVEAKAIVSAAYGRFDGVPRKLTGVASIPATAVSPGDRVDLAIAGVAPREFICPHPGLFGMNRLDVYRHAGLANYGSPELDTLLLAWDGTFA